MSLPDDATEEQLQAAAEALPSDFFVSGPLLEAWNNCRYRRRVVLPPPPQPPPPTPPQRAEKRPRQMHLETCAAPTDAALGLESAQDVAAAGLSKMHARVAHVASRSSGATALCIRDGASALRNALSLLLVLLRARGAATHVLLVVPAADVPVWRDAAARAQDEVAVTCFVKAAGTARSCLTALRKQRRPGIVIAACEHLERCTRDPAKAPRNLLHSALVDGGAAGWELVLYHAPQNACALPPSSAAIDLLTHARADTLLIFGDDNAPPNLSKLCESLRTQLDAVELAELSLESEEDEPHALDDSEFDSNSRESSPGIAELSTPIRSSESPESEIIKRSRRRMRRISLTPASEKRDSCSALRTLPVNVTYSHVSDTDKKRTQKAKNRAVRIVKNENDISMNKAQVIAPTAKPERTTSLVKPEAVAPSVRNETGVPLSQKENTKGLETSLVRRLVYSKTSSPTSMSRLANALRTLSAKKCGRAEKNSQVLSGLLKKSTQANAERAKMKPQMLSDLSEKKTQLPIDCKAQAGLCRIEPKICAAQSLLDPPDSHVDLKIGSAPLSAPMLNAMKSPYVTLRSKSRKPPEREGTFNLYNDTVVDVDEFDIDCFVVNDVRVKTPPAANRRRGVMKSARHKHRSTASHRKSLSSDNIPVPVESIASRPFINLPPAKDVTKDEVIVIDD